MSIAKKLIALVSVTVVVLIVSLCSAGYILISNMGNNAATEQLAVSSRVVRGEIETTLQAMTAIGEMLRTNPQFALAVKDNTLAALQRTAKDLLASPMVDLVTICDANGMVLLRGHSDQKGDVLPPSRLSMSVPLKEGRAISGMEPGNVVKLTLASGIPIRHEGTIVGVAIIGMDMASGTFVNNMKRRLNAECTIFIDDVRMATSVMRDGKPATGTKLNNPEIFQNVMVEGQEVHARNMILGAEYDTIYWPWQDLTGKNRGMFFVGLSRSTIEAEQSKVVFYFALAGLGFGAIMLACGIMVARAIAKPLRTATRFAEEVARGNLDESLTVTTRDEVGSLARALGIMVENLKEKIRESEIQSREASAQTEKALEAMREASAAKEEAEAGRAELLRVAENVEKVVSRLTTAVESINRQVDTSTNQVAFQHERVTNSATAMEQMKATVLEVARSAAGAAEGAERSTGKAREGEEIVKESIMSISGVQKDTEHLSAAMHRLGGQAESIGTVMTVINDIADQTNLLALNAAIEAARAGEAGRGFAVVADEVRKLAEKTMVATKEVSSAISGIQAGTRESITAVDRTGENLVHSTELVARSGEALQEIVAESDAIADQIRSIATASEEQASSSEEIARGLEEINISASETAEAMRASSDATAELTNQVRDLRTLVMQLRQ